MEGAQVALVTFCEKHPKVEVSLYCLKCDEVICPHCIKGKHDFHTIGSLPEAKSQQNEKLREVLRQLNEKKSYFNKIYEQCKLSNDSLKKDMFDQKTKVIEEVEHVFKEYIDEVDLLHHKQEEWHASACSDILSMIESIEKQLESNKLTNWTKDSERIHERLAGMVSSPLPSQTFTTGIISRTVIINLLGKLWNKLKIQIKGKSRSIKVIVPMGGNEAWIAEDGDMYFTLISLTDGSIINTSVKVCNSVIIDAKRFSDDVLFTHYNGNEIVKMSVDGKATTLFSDLQPFFTRGLYVTSSKHVFVCVKSSDVSKVVQLGENGVVMQTIQNDETGAPIFFAAYSVIAFQTGEVVVTDKDSVVFVDNKGRHSCTWRGELNYGTICKFTPECITHDNFNLFITDYYNQNVFVVKKDGSEGKHLFDTENRLKDPWAITMSDNRLLLIGHCTGSITLKVY